MNPRSERTDCLCSFCFLASSAIAVESVRALTTASEELSSLPTVSLQLRWSNTERVAQPDRRSLDSVLCAGLAGTHFPLAASLATHSASALAGRRETEYISAANEETATTSSN